LLRESGASISAYQLQGSLVFSTSEIVVREVLERSKEIEFLILDLKNVLGLDECACRLLYHLTVALQTQGKTVVFARAGRWTMLRRYMKTKLGARFETDFRAFDDTDPALEWCEEQWLSSRLPARAGDGARTIESYDLFVGLTKEEIAQVGKLLELRKFAPDEVLVETGAEAGEIYFLHRGNARITITLAGGTQKRLGLFSPGMAFGEVAMLDGSKRSATVVAETAVECHTLKRMDFDALGESHPRIKIVLLTNMALGLARLLRKATREFSTFDY
jgi:glutaminase